MMKAAFMDPLVDLQLSRKLDGCNSLMALQKELANISNWIKDLFYLHYSSIADVSS